MLCIIVGCHKHQPLWIIEFFKRKGTEGISIQFHRRLAFIAACRHCVDLKYIFLIQFSLLYIVLLVIKPTNQVICITSEKSHLLRKIIIIIHMDRLPHFGKSRHLWKILLQFTVVGWDLIIFIVRKHLKLSERIQKQKQANKCNQKQNA